GPARRCHAPWRAAGRIEIIHISAPPPGRDYNQPMRTPLVAAILLLTFHAASAEKVEDELDSTVRQVLEHSQVAGASGVVARGGKVLFHQGYGVSDIGLEVAAKPDSVYHIVGPMLPFTGVAVMQQVERGKLSLADDIGRYLPEFPTQGHRV